MQPNVQPITGQLFDVDLGAPSPEAQEGIEKLKGKEDLRFTELFTSFVQHTCQGTDVEVAKRQAQSGYEVVRRIRTGEADKDGPAERAANMASFIWYLTYLSCENGQYLTNGSFVMADPGHKIVDYFAAEGMGSYRGGSSHFKGRVPKFEGEKRNHGYHMDLPLGQLPCEKRTVLFSSVTMMNNPNEYAFFKHEDWGEKTPYEIFRHSCAFLLACFVKEGEGLRKEHAIPEKIELLYNELLSSLPEEDQKTAKKEMKLFGLSSIYHRLSSEPEFLKNKNAQKLRNYLKAEYPDIIEGLRTGQEVLLLNLDHSLTNPPIAHRGKVEIAKARPKKSQFKTMAKIAIAILVIVALGLLLFHFGGAAFLSHHCFSWLSHHKLAVILSSAALLLIIGGASYARYKIKKNKILAQFKRELGIETA